MLYLEIGNASMYSYTLGCQMALFEMTESKLLRYLAERIISKRRMREDMWKAWDCDGSGYLFEPT